MNPLEWGARRRQNDLERRAQDAFLAEIAAYTSQLDALQRQLDEVRAVVAALPRPSTRVAGEPARPEPDIPPATLETGDFPGSFTISWFPTITRVLCTLKWSPTM